MQRNPNNQPPYQSYANQPPYPPSHVGPPYGPTPHLQKKRGMPGWAIALVVAACAVIALPILLILVVAVAISPGKQQVPSTEPTQNQTAPEQSVSSPKAPPFGALSGDDKESVWFAALVYGQEEIEKRNGVGGAVALAQSSDGVVIRQKDGLYRADGCWVDWVPWDSINTKNPNGVKTRIYFTIRLRTDNVQSDNIEDFKVSSFSFNESR